MALAAAAGGSGPASAQTIRDTSGAALSVLPRNDDASTGAVPLGFSLNFFGVSRSAVYVNNNGNVTLDSPLSEFTPFNLTATDRQIIAPFFADVDTRGRNSAEVTYGRGTVGGRPAFFANWNGVGYYDSRDDKLNRFQLVVIDRSDIASGDVDIEFNYQQIQWETGDASGGESGHAGASARAGYANGTGQSGTSVELPGSGVNGALLDSNQLTALIRQSNIGVPGRYLFRVRNGQIFLVDPIALSVERQEQANQQTAEAIMLNAVRTVLSAVGNRVAALRTGSGRFSYAQAGGWDGESAVLSMSGLSGGDADAGPKLGLWTSGSLSLLDNSRPQLGFSGSTKTLFLGADTLVDERIVAGFTFAVESTALSLKPDDGSRRTRGGGGTLYAAYILTDWLYVSGQASYFRLNNELRTSPLGGRVTGDFPSDRLILNATLTASHQLDAWELTGRLGYNHARESFESYLASDGAAVNLQPSVLGQFFFGGEVGYDFGGPQVFASAIYEYDNVGSSANTDRNGALFGAGLRYGVTDSLALELQGNAQALRDDERQYILAGSLRYRF